MDRHESAVNEQLEAVTDPRERATLRRVTGVSAPHDPTLVGEIVPQIGLVALARVAEAEAATSPEQRAAMRIAPDEVDDDAPEIDNAKPAPPWLPPRFHGATFSGFRVETPSQGKALAAARGFAERAAVGGGAMLALIGQPGTGKSHLLYAIARTLIMKSQKVYARPWYRLADELRYGGTSPFANKELEAFQVRRLLWEQRIILLDEVRPTASTALDDTELAKLACHAWDQEIALLVTTNVNPLEQMMGPAAASRFTQVIIEGPDRRQPTLARSA